MEGNPPPNPPDHPTITPTDPPTKKRHNKGNSSISRHAWGRNKKDIAPSATIASFPPDRIAPSSTEVKNTENKTIHTKNKSMTKIGT
jgi:hypothetical protein